MSQCSTAGGNCNLQLQDDGTLKCETHNSIEIVGKLYATEIGEDFGKVNTTYDENNGLREPAVITGNGSEYDAQYYSNAGFNSLTDMENGLKDEYKDMAISVAKYKGFYVGRYELGLEGTNPVSKNASKNSNVTTTDSSNANTKMWYGLYSKCKEFAKESDNKSVVSSMIWGSQYDAMMNWMQVNGVDVSSTVDDTNIIKNNNKTTGFQKEDLIKNVYDLYGCHYEWTLEVNSTRFRIVRR